MDLFAHFDLPFSDYEVVLSLVCTYNVFNTFVDVVLHGARESGILVWNSLENGTGIKWKHYSNLVKLLNFNGHTEMTGWVNPVGLVYHKWSHIHVLDMPVI